MNGSRTALMEEVAAVAARMVVEDGLDFAAAKRRAIKQMGLGPRTALPDNATVEAAVREHIDLFCADTQPGELRALRETAWLWMTRLARFRPHLSGAVWHGWATRHSDIHIDLFCDDPKEPEWALLDHRVDYHQGSAHGRQGDEVQALTLRARCDELSQWVLVHLIVHDLDDQRGSLRPDAEGRKPRGDIADVQRLIEPPNQ